MAKILYALDMQSRDHLITAMDHMYLADIAELLKQIKPY